MSKQKLLIWFQRLYVRIMMAIIGRALVATSEVDDEVREEFSGLPEGYLLEMMVMPNGPGFKVEVGQGGVLKLSDRNDATDLSIRFKHISHAFLVFSFQESTSQAFANDRMIADGEVSHAIRLVRCMNKMEALILPKLIASLAVKRYPRVALGDKIKKAARIYLSVTKQLILGS